MKRNLLFAAALLAGVAVSAQEIGEMDFSVIASDQAVAVPAGTTVAVSTSITVSTGFDDSFKQTGCNTDEFEVMDFSGMSIDVSQGVTGSANPTDAAGQSPANMYSAPAAGCCYTFTAPGSDPNKLWGYFYAVGKLSTNKQYWVVEAGASVGYELHMVASGQAYHFALAGDPENLNILSDDFVKASYPDLVSIMNAAGEPDWTTGIPSPDQMAGTPRGDWAGTGASVNGLGYIKFPVYEGTQYYFGAAGSKLSLAGFYTDKAGDAVVTLKDSEGAVGDLQLSVGEGGGDNAISSVESAAEVVAEEYYTVSGVRVAEMVPGLNLVKQTLSDGSVKTVKVIK